MEISGAACRGRSIVDESEGDNADVIGQEDVEGPVNGDQMAVTEEGTESDDAASAQSTGKMDLQALGWTKREASAGQDVVSRENWRARAENSWICGEVGRACGRACYWANVRLSRRSLRFFTIFIRGSMALASDIGKVGLTPRRPSVRRKWSGGCSGKPISENNMSCWCECPGMIRLLRTSD